MLCKYWSFVIMMITAMNLFSLHKALRVAHTVVAAQSRFYCTTTGLLHVQYLKQKPSARH